MAQAWAFKAEEQRLARLKAEYDAALAAITDEQCLAADNVRRLKASYDEAVARRAQLRQVEREIAEHPVRAEIERLKAALATAEAGLRAAMVEAVESDLSAKKALALRKETVELRAHVELLTEGLAIWSRRQRAAAPAETDGELQVAVHRMGEKLNVAMRNERSRLACSANPEFEHFALGASNRGRM